MHYPRVSQLTSSVHVPIRAPRLFPSHAPARGPLCTPRGGADPRAERTQPRLDLSMVQALAIGGSDAGLPTRAGVADPRFDGRTPSPWCNKPNGPGDETPDSSTAYVACRPAAGARPVRTAGPAPGVAEPRDPGGAGLAGPAPGPGCRRAHDVGTKPPGPRNKILPHPGFVSQSGDESAHSGGRHPRGPAASGRVPDRPRAGSRSSARARTNPTADSPQVAVPKTLHARSARAPGARPARGGPRAIVGVGGVHPGVGTCYNRGPSGPAGLPGRPPRPRTHRPGGRPCP
jgi:hypothetical protein